MSTPTTSGISARAKWLGRVPENWEVLPLKYVATVFPSNVDKHSRDSDLPVKLCNYTDVYYNDQITGTLDFMKATATRDQIQKFRLRAGDTIITKDSETADDIGLSAYVPEDLENIVCGYHLSMIRPSSQIIGRFVKRIFDTHYVKAVLETSANGLTRVGLGQYALNNIEIPLPPVAAQEEIVDFLDRETAKIDALIGKQEQLIATLLEDRSATISAAITSGIDNNGKLPAGRGEENSTPAHWSETKIRHVALLNPSKKRAIEKLAEDELVTFVPMDSIGEDGSIDVNRSRPLSEVRSGYSFFERDDVLMAKVTPCFENGKLAVAANLPHPCGFATTEVTVLRPTRAVYGQFLCYLLRSQTFRRASIAEMTGAGGLRRVPDNQVRNFIFSRPPLPEQRVIVQFLDDHCLKIDALIEKTIEMIEALHEYRSALITNTVTGKVDVREAV